MATDQFASRYDAPGNEGLAPWYSEQRRAPMFDGPIGLVARLLVDQGIGVRLHTREGTMAVGTVKDVQDGVITLVDAFGEQRTPIAEVELMSIPK